MNVNESVISIPFRGGSRAAATFKMDRFVIIVNGFQPLTIITKCSILDVEAALDPPLPLDQIYCIRCFELDDNLLLNIAKDSGFLKEA